MTTICAVQGDGWVVVGWDSNVAEEGGRSYTVDRSWSKVVQRNNYLLGAAGDVRAINLLHHQFDPPKTDLTGARLDKFITANVIPALREVFEVNGYTATRRSGGEQHGADILIVVNGSVYEIGSDWSWCRDTDGMYAVGSGGDYALGYLYGQPRFKDPEIAKQAVTKSLTIASRFDCYTGAPFHTKVVLG